jgi:hypothetical protein
MIMKVTTIRTLTSRTSMQKKKRLICSNRQPENEADPKAPKIERKIPTSLIQIQIRKTSTKKKKEAGVDQKGRKIKKILKSSQEMLISGR